MAQSCCHCFFSFAFFCWQYCNFHPVFETTFQNSQSNVQPSSRATSRRAPVAGPTPWTSMAPAWWRPSTPAGRLEGCVIKADQDYRVVGHLLLQRSPKTQMYEALSRRGAAHIRNPEEPASPLRPEFRSIDPVVASKGRPQLPDKGARL